MTTAAYIRVSSDQQDTTRQRRSITGCAEMLGLVVDLWYEDSEGKNPRHRAEKRKAFQRLLSDVEAGRVKTIIVDQQDRFGTKDAFEWGAFIGKLRKHRCRLLDSTGRELSADDTGTVITGVVAALTSRDEQRQKAHRSVTGKVGYAGRGEYQGGYAPFGTDVACFGPDGREKWRTVYVAHLDRLKVYPDGRRERFKGKNVTPAKDTTDTLRLRPSIETDRIKVAKQIFGWYVAEDLSPRQIADRLNELKISPVFGEAWYKHTIQALLRNPVYIGLPTWNKRAGASFAEYVDGQVRAVNEPRRGKRRKIADQIRPDKPEFAPIIDSKTWETTQRKLSESSTKHTRPRRAPHTAELWLRPFLVCGHCMKPMHATRGLSNDRLWPSYFCGTYNKYGPRNPTGCHCHRVKHDVIEKIVADYLAKQAPKIGKLLKASQGGDVEAIRPILETVTGTQGAFAGVACDILSFIDEHGDGEATKLLKQGRSFIEIYSIIFERVRPKLEKDIARRQADLDKMLDDFRGLPEKLRQRAVARMEPLQAELDSLESQLVDWRQPHDNLRAELAARQTSLKTAVATIGRQGGDRVKSEALRGVVDRIVCRFRHVKTKATLNNGKSILTSVEIYPISADKDCFRIEGSPATD
ncbi:MAG TPA: recombinase family protein [Planctomycetaceae bacterium]|jgi:DNA invertase Pin-like site-specific DNA recombinase